MKDYYKELEQIQADPYSGLNVFHFWISDQPPRSAYNPRKPPVIWQIYVEWDLTKADIHLVERMKTEADMNVKFWYMIVSKGGPSTVHEVTPQESFPASRSKIREFGDIANLDIMVLTHAFPRGLEGTTPLFRANMALQPRAYGANHAQPNGTTINGHVNGMTNGSTNGLTIGVPGNVANGGVGMPPNGHVNGHLQGGLHSHPTGGPVPRIVGYFTWYYVRHTPVYEF